jgi:MtN3 and saliva related transmembrane protein
MEILNFDAEWIGFVAAALTTGAFLPQTFKVWKNKSAKDLSLSMYVAMLLGITLWLIYGISIDSPSMIAANSVTLVLVISILYFKLKFK